LGAGDSIGGRDITGFRELQSSTVETPFFQEVHIQQLAQVLNIGSKMGVQPFFQSEISFFTYLSVGIEAIQQ
jgi:hypothetical protein